MILNTMIRAAQKFSGVVIPWLGLIFYLIVPSFAKAEVAVPCEPEITDQVIVSGNFLDGENCVISPAGDSDVFRFQAVMGEKWLIRATDQSGGSAPGVCIELVGPDGMPTTNGSVVCDNTNAEIREMIQQGGIHTIIISEADHDTMPYGLVLERLAPPSPLSVLLPFGSNIEDAIDGSGDVDLYLFYGILHDQIAARVTDQSGGSAPGVCIELIGPDGMPTTNGSVVCDNTNAEIRETIQQEGVHTILVREADHDTMGYVVDLQCLTGGCFNSAALTPKTLIGLGEGGQGWIEIKEGDPPYTHVAWTQVDWSSYNSANGETRPIWCDVDGDNKDEIVTGLGMGSNGWLEIKDDADTGYNHLAWIQVNWAAYNILNGETFPTCRDVDNDNKDEIIIGLGTDGDGWLEIKDDAMAGYANLDWLRLNWAAYNSANGETRPAAGR